MFQVRIVGEIQVDTEMQHQCEDENDEVEGEDFVVFCCYSVDSFKLSIVGGVAVWEGRGRHWVGYKLLSVSVTPYYLDSNYTCQLSLGPHPSLRLKPHTLHFSVFDKPCAHSLPVLYSCLTFPGVSQYYDRVDSLPPLPLCIHCHSNPLCFVLPYSWRTQRLNSHQISYMVAEMAT